MKTIYSILIALIASMICATESGAQVWTNLGTGLNSGGHALAFDAAGNLYVAGDFTNAGGVEANRVAKWDGTNWNNLQGDREGGNVYELAFDSHGNLYAAGGAYIEKWNGTSWTNIGAGIDWFVYALACDNIGNLYAGGSFSQIGGRQVNYIAKWNGTTWTNLGAGMNGYVEALACDNHGNLYAGGWFTNAGGVAANHIAKWNGIIWTNLGSGVLGNERPEDTPRTCVKALAFDNSGNLYAGGDFSTAGGIDAFAVAKWNGSTWANLGGGMDFMVNALDCDSSGNLYAGGEFNNAGGLAANRIAKWNGARWSCLGSGLNNSATAVICDGAGNLYCGGFFTVAGGVTVNYVAKCIPGTLGPIIKANGSNNDIVINRGDNLSITVQLDPGQYIGTPVDWWVLARAGSYWFYMDEVAGWTQGGAWRPVHQGPLFDLPPTLVLNLGSLGTGAYTFYFAVDYPMNGVLDGALWYDSVNVTVQ